MLGINARVEDLKIQLITDINKAQMPACILDFILTEILQDVRSQRASEGQREREAYRKETDPGPPVKGEVPDGKEEA